MSLAAIAKRDLVEEVEEVEEGMGEARWCKRRVGLGLFSYAKS